MDGFPTGLLVALNRKGLEDKGQERLPGLSRKHLVGKLSPESEKERIRPH